MVDLESARWVWRWSRADRVVMLITYLSTLVFEIQYAIYLGVVLSLLMLVRRVGQLQLVEMVESGPRMYREIEIDEEPAQREAMLARSGGRRTVPQIFIGERHVGGFDDLYALEQSGELDHLLGRAG